METEKETFLLRKGSYCVSSTLRYEVQTLADTMCNLNETFGTEDDFVNLWKSGQGANDDDKKLIDNSFKDEKDMDSIPNSTFWMKDCAFMARKAKIQQ